jgi:enoyl-CoA hydratase
MARHVLLDIADRVATVTIDRPEARNALNRALLDELVATLRDVDADDRVDVIVLTATDPVFCAGLDLKALESGELDISSLTHEGDPWPVLRKPMIGAINGAAVTVGLELALRCDVLIASDRSSFGDTHARVGILPFWGMTTALPAAVGARAATMLSLTGNFLAAADALRLGLVALVVAHDDLSRAARQLAADIVSNDQDVVRALLAAYRENARTTVAEAAAAEQERALAWQG